jgi:hypothetical protein
VGFTLRCPDCRGKFPWASNTAFPQYCPLCSADIGHNRDDDDIVVPFIRTSQSSKAVDDVYRQMEAASEERAKLAAEMVGCSPEEMSGLKITDLRPTKHPGDIAAPPVVNEITRVMDQAPIGALSTLGPQMASAAASGYLPSRNARTRTLIQESHQEKVRAYVGVDHTAVSDRPALETQQIGYKRRG